MFLLWAKSQRADRTNQEVDITGGFADARRVGTKHMASLDWSQCPAVESVPGRRSGAWVFRDTRMPVATVFENLEAGVSIDEIVEQFHVTPEQVKAVLEFAARSLDPPPSSSDPVSPSTDAHSL
jgi:uncharacterized protein (DUF433 family)